MVTTDSIFRNTYLLPPFYYQSFIKHRYINSCFKIGISVKKKIFDNFVNDSLEIVGKMKPLIKKHLPVNNSLLKDGICKKNIFG